jgi:hypothetical protein
MKKQYTKKQIQEAIKYWTTQLNLMESSNTSEISKNRYDITFLVENTKFHVKNKINLIIDGNDPYDAMDNIKKLFVGCMITFFNCTEVTK